MRNDYRRRRGGRLAALLGVVLGFGIAAAIAYAVVGVGLGDDDASSDDPSTAATETAPPKPVLRIIFPEGFTRKEMAQRIAAVNQIAQEERGISPSLRPPAYLRAAERRASLPAGFKNVEPPHLEGFLFPATYSFNEDTTSRQLVEMQLTAFERAWSRVDTKEARRKNLTPYEVLIIASMVEKEVQVPRERALVAAVIYNRLRAQMPLGIDATIRYATDNWTRPIRQSELEADGPYNTRLRTGLPPTPIGNPGLSSIRAAAKPANVGYRYFVVKPGTCGEHAFSNTIEQFQRDSARYNQARAEAGNKSPTTC